MKINFHIGDAQALDFPENSFDAVINVEASHCYPSQQAFYASVKRVLKPGGRLLHADFRPHNELSQWENDITANFHIATKTDITPHVIRALQRTTERFRTLAHRLSPKILHRTMETFAGVEGSTIYNSFVNGERVYLSFQLVKST